ncbi:hypothetical protein Tco_0823001 [Tanacetum coccineum]|uniref:Uncharacterized protein n=1 Tax=Tanacetum coccineum TaxID=301880 RepID=A0ABQ5AJ94_9ASTR
MATLNEPNPQGEGLGSGPRRQETIGGAPAQTRSERVLEKPNEPPLPEGHTSRSREGNMEHTFELTDNVPPTPYDSTLSGGNTLGSDEGRMELIQELMETYTSLTKRVLALEEVKTAQDRRELFKSRVETSTDKILGEDSSKQGRNDDRTKELNLTYGADTKVIVEDKEVSAASVPVSTATPSTPPTTTIFGDEDLTIAQTLVKMRSKKAKEKEKGVVLRDKEEPPRLGRSTTTLKPLPTIDPKDKGRGVLVEEELVKVKRMDQGLAQIESDTELAQRLYEEELEELDKERQKQEEATNAALAKEFDEIQARIDADHELTVRLTHEEQEKYTIEERVRLLEEFFERRNKLLAVERAESIRNKPPTRTQVKNRMITYLKHMGKYTHQQLKHKNFKEVQKLYEREKKWIKDFLPMDNDSQQQAESTKKRPRANSK